MNESTTSPTIPQTPPQAPAMQLTFRQRFIHNLVSSFAFFMAAFATWLQVNNLMQGDWVALGTILYYGIVATLFLIRKPSLQHSTRFMHWVIALGASWVPFLIMATPQHINILVWISVPIQAFSFVFILLTLVTLGRGFGVIAARRDIKTQGVYRFVRHPLYAGELLSGIAVILQNLSLYNVCLFLTVAACQLLRIQEEETILSEDPVYVEYKKRVPYRLIPGIF